MSGSLQSSEKNKNQLVSMLTTWLIVCMQGNVPTPKSLFGLKYGQIMESTNELRNFFPFSEAKFRSLNRRPY